jgi:hypothetical protein
MEMCRPNPREYKHLPNDFYASVTRSYIENTNLLLPRYQTLFVLLYTLRKVMEIVSELKHLRGCTTVRSKGDVAMMSGKINAL